MTDKHTASAPKFGVDPLTGSDSQTLFNSVMERVYLADRFHDVLPEIESSLLLLLRADRLTVISGCAMNRKSSPSSKPATKSGKYACRFRRVP